MSAAHGYPTVEVPGMRGTVVQAVVHESERGRIVALETAYDVTEANRGRDVAVNASYTGVLPARFIAEHAPRGVIGCDCAVGKDGAGIAGLWYFEALGMPAAATDVNTMQLGDGVDMFEGGVISVVNEPARSCGLHPGQAVREAARLLLEVDPSSHSAAEVTNRQVVLEGTDGNVVCTDSIAFGLPEDEGTNVLCTAGHTGVSAAYYLRRFRPRGFICSDGGKGKNDAGVAALKLVEADGLAGATVDAQSARMGDGLSTYHDGVISACNEPAARAGVRIGQPARDAAARLLEAGARRE